MLYRPRVYIQYRLPGEWNLALWRRILKMFFAHNRHLANVCQMELKKSGESDNLFTCTVHTRVVMSILKRHLPLGVTLKKGLIRVRSGVYSWCCFNLGGPAVSPPQAVLFPSQGIPRSLNHQAQPCTKSLHRVLAPMPRNFYSKSISAGLTLISDPRLL